MPLSGVEISERVGRIPRRLTLPDIGVFETTDNESVDRALAALGRSPGLVHWLEARWSVAIASLVVVAVGSLLFVRFGVPAIANLAARTLPVSVDRVLGAQTLELLDRILLEPSALSASRQLELQQRFEAMTPDRDEGRNDRLELRAAPTLGPNALALPSGIIVMTDELVLLAEHDEELVAVLAHELGHVRGRHALRQLLQSSGVSAVAFALLGDISSASALLSAAPVLIEAKHSRDFEREADAFAKEWLAGNAIPAHRFDAILCRMQSESGGDADSPIARYLSTHPTTDERVRCEPELDAPGPDQDGA
jgi:Zn-dependent protease with chaperone function